MQIKFGGHVTPGRPCAGAHAARPKDGEIGGVCLRLRQTSVRRLHFFVVTWRPRPACHVFKKSTSASPRSLYQTLLRSQSALRAHHSGMCASSSHAARHGF